jgi:hypothetical protein
MNEWIDLNFSWSALGEGVSLWSWSSLVGCVVVVQVIAIVTARLSRLAFGGKGRHSETSLSFHTVPDLPTITHQQHDNGFSRFFHIKSKHECTFSSPRDQSQRCSFPHHFTKRTTDQA